MLKPHFKEGTDLLNQPPGVPLEIQLSEDDRLAVEAICYIMHLRSDNVVDNSKYAGSAKTLRIARASDMYDCSVAVRPTMRSRLSAEWPHVDNVAFTNELSLETAHRLFIAAYLVSDAESFRRLGREIVTHAPKTFPVTWAEGESDKIVLGFESLEQQVAELKARIIAFVAKRIHSRSELRKSKTGFQCAPTCTCTEALTVAHMKDLGNKCFYPSSKIGESSLQDAIRNLLFFSPTSCGNPNPCSGNKCISTLPAVRTFTKYEGLKKFAFNADADIKGPCL